MNLDNVRNIGIVAHIDAGKTTTTERMLFYSGREHRMGDVDSGNTVTDFLEEERERGITIVSAAVSFDWNEFRINLIDTPGHVDFTAEVERSLRVLDGAVGVFSGVEGVEAQSETVWRQANRYGVPRIAFINKLDRVGADFDRVVQAMRDQLNAPVIPISIPIGLESEFEGVIDLIAMKALSFTEESQGRDIVESEIPDSHAAEAAAARTALLDAVGDLSDELATRYLEGETITPEEIRAVLRRATIDGTLVPTLCGSSLRFKGVQPLLDAVGHYLPSPIDMGEVSGTHPKTGDAIVRKPDPKAPFAALAFKTVTDSHGELIWLRVYSGSARKGQQVLNPRTGKPERLGRLIRLYADRREEVQEISVGDIVATAGPRYTRTGDTLCVKDKPILMMSVDFPDTVVSMAIEPASAGDRDALEESLARMAKDDPTFETRNDEDTGQVLISGMGELHLEVLINRLTRDFKVAANVGRPRVAYKQTVRKAATATGTFDRTKGEGVRQFAEVELRVEPYDGEDRLKIDNEAPTSAVPSGYVPAIESAIRTCFSGGVGLHYPVVNCRVRILGGVFEAGDANEIAFEAAGSLAMERAFEAGVPVLLEPMMKLEIHVPEQNLGDVLSDLQKRRCDVSGIGELHGMRVVRGLAAMNRMFGYSNLLRSMTQGRGTFTMEHSSYAPVSDDDAERLTF